MKDSCIEIVRTVVRRYSGSDLSDGTLAEFAQLLERREYQKNEIILDAGQVSRHYYIVEQGLIRLFYYKDGRDLTEHFHHEGNMALCIESLFRGKPTDLMIQALEPSVVHFVDFAGFKKLSRSNPEFFDFAECFLENSLIGSQRKADAWRFENAYERYERFCSDYPEAALRAPISCIATYLFMTPETLSRIRSNTL